MLNIPRVDKALLGEERCWSQGNWATGGGGILVQNCLNGNCEVPLQLLDKLKGYNRKQKAM